MDNCVTTVRHWLPRITRCPLSPWPDLVWFSCTFEGFAEIYEIRERIATVVPHGRKQFMETLASEVIEVMPNNCTCVTVRLLFSRHEATIWRK